MQVRESGPSPEQLRWHQQVESLGCVVSGDSFSEIHHVAGCGAVHNDIAIGQWFILPLHHQFHRTGLITINNAQAYFTEQYGSQVHLFQCLCEHYQTIYGALPFDQAVMESICSTTY